MSNPRGQQRDKPFRDALRMEIAAAGDNLKTLRTVAKALIKRGRGGDVVAIREIADRLDGKVAPSLLESLEVGGEGAQIASIEVSFIHPKAAKDDE